ncbi:MAG: ribosomal-processing cysteine protease Prp [Ruminococcus sp.]|nr:ribosomal-processing cysteine protease Prp [Ruminococcus sp.]
MISATFHRQSGSLLSVCVSGHAEFADPGQDIVCASVSSAVMLTANTITEIFSIKADVSATADAVTIRLSEMSADGSRLLEGLLLHLREIACDFPDNLKLQITEV